MAEKGWCKSCAKWEKDYIEMEALYHEGKEKVSKAIMDRHVAQSLHEVAVHEREEMAKEVIRLKLQLKQQEDDEKYIEEWFEMNLSGNDRARLAEYCRARREQDNNAEEDASEV